MRCPHCSTENREDRASCYHCGRDLSMLQLISSRARMHFSQGLEFAKESRYYEALGELNSALELNSRMTEAHVLRGSILGRLDRPEEAREALDEALKLSPHAARAHRYLLELGDVEKATPLLRRLRVVIAGSAAVALFAVVLVATIGIRGEPDFPGAPGAESRLAWAMQPLGDFNLAEAEFRLARLAPAERRTAELLITQAIQPRLDSIAGLIASGSLDAADRELATLDGFKLRSVDQTELTRLRLVARGSRLDRLATQFQSVLDLALNSGRVPGALLPDYQAAQQNLLAADPEASAEWESRRSDLQRKYLQRLEEAVTAADGRLADLAALRGLADVLGQSEALRPALEAALTHETDALLADARRAAEEGDRTAFESASEAVRALPIPAPDAAEQLDYLRRRFVEQELAQLETGFAEAAASGDDAALLSIAESIRTLSGAPLSDERAARVQQARSRLALSGYYAVMELGDRLDAGELTFDEARNVLKLIARARGAALPARLADRADENLHYFAAQAHRVLGDNVQAWEEMENLRKKNPDSVYLALD